MDKAKEAIVQKLKASGCRITKQRLMLLDIILEENCSCCKEIYYRASRIDPSIGTATVYRMINKLEECRRSESTEHNSTVINMQLIKFINSLKIFEKDIPWCYNLQKQKRLPDTNEGMSFLL